MGKRETEHICQITQTLLFWLNKNNDPSTLTDMILQPKSKENTPPLFFLKLQHCSKLLGFYNDCAQHKSWLVFKLQDKKRTIKTVWSEWKVAPLSPTSKLWRLNILIPQFGSILKIVDVFWSRRRLMKLVGAWSAHCLAHRVFPSHSGFRTALPSFRRLVPQVT